MSLRLFLAVALLWCAGTAHAQLLEEQPLYTVFYPYLTEGDKWRGLPPGHAASIIDEVVAEVPETSESGHPAVACPLRWTPVTVVGPVLLDEEGDPQVLFNGKWMFLADVYDSIGEDCKWLF